MQVNFGGIKCDNPQCNFEDNNVTMTQYPDYLNKPCPQCGSNLLTEADFKAVIRMQELSNSRIIKSIEAVSKFFGAKEKTMTMETNGTGVIKFKEIKE
jgi:hypothetical protein